MKSEGKLGFTYTVRLLDRFGNILEEDPPIHNLIPEEGINHVISTVWAGGVQVPTWYIGIFSGNFTPTGSETAATLPGLATEETAYSASGRVAFVPGAVTGGAVDNSASVAQFTLTAAKTIYGGFLSSASAKGATSGTISSVVRFASPKTGGIGDILQIVAAQSLISS